MLADAAGAGNDLAAALKLAPSNAYYVLWVYAARVLAEQKKDADELRANAERVDPGPWPGIIIGLYLGSVTPEAALKTATEAQDETARTEQICEADFFVAIYQIGKSARSAAQRLFQSAADQCPHTHFQYTVSKFELGLLNRGAETHQARHQSPSPGAAAWMASACTPPESSLASAALIMRWRSSRLFPRKASDTI